MFKIVITHSANSDLIRCLWLFKNTFRMDINMASYLLVIFNLTESMFAVILSISLKKN